MILIINPWSSSVKYSLYKNNWPWDTQGQLLFWWVIDIKNIKKFANPIENIYKDLASFEKDKSESIISEIKKIWFRVVHWANKYIKSTRINNKFISDFKNLISFAPFHNKKAFECIVQAKKTFKKANMYAIFDTSFHSTILKENKYYAFPMDFSKKHSIQKYWFHGISYEYLVSEIWKRENIKNKKIIICHLWSWCSISAIKNSKSVDVSMWFTPVSWIMSSKRTGDFDPSIIIHLLSKWIKLSKIEDIINNKSWLLWLSWTSDMKSILNKSKEGDLSAIFTVNKFVLDIQKYIWSFVWELWWLDFLIFSWWIGEWSSYIRELVVNNFDFLNLKIDKRKNNSNKQWLISSRSSKIKIYMLKTNEEEQMCRLIGQMC